MTARPSAAPRRGLRRVEALLVLGVLVAAAAVTAVAWAGQSGASAGARTAAPTAQSRVATADADAVEDGETVYLRDCAWCHGKEGQGSQYAPSLQESGPAAAHFWLTTGRMPLASVEDEVEAGPPAYPPETLQALIEYVGTLGVGPNIPEVLHGDIKRGRVLFLYNCAPCHSASGTGMILPAGDFAPELFDSTPTQVVEAVRLGPGSMPPFSDRHLTKEQADDIAAYVQELGQQQRKGGNPLDWIGPIYEGAVALLIGVPLLVVVIRLLGRRAP